MERLIEFLISVDNKLLDVLFQPIVSLSPEKAREKPALIGFFVLLANAIWLIGTIVMQIVYCHVPGSPWCWGHTTFGQDIIGVLRFSSWMGMAGGNQYLMRLSNNLSEEQRPGMANWFRAGGIIFRYPFLIGAIVVTLWTTWQTGPVFWLWWAGTCFMGCNSMPPREPFWFRQWRHA